MNFIEDIKKLPASERIKIIKELQEKKKRELEELEKKAKKEVKEIEEVLKISIDDATKEEINEKKKAKKIREQLKILEEENLEATINQEKINNNNNNEQNTDYKTGLEYTPLNTIVEDLNKLQYATNWGSKEEELYQQRKEELKQTAQYKNTLTEDLVEKLYTAKSILDKLGYKS